MTASNVVAEPAPLEPSKNGERQTVIWILGTIAMLCILSLGAIGVFSIQLAALDPPREAGSSVGALRENIMSVLATIIGALAMKAKGASS